MQKDAGGPEPTQGPLKRKAHEGFDGNESSDVGSQQPARQHEVGSWLVQMCLHAKCQQAVLWKHRPNNLLIEGHCASQAKFWWGDIPPELLPDGNQHLSEPYRSKKSYTKHVGRARVCVNFTKQNYWLYSGAKDGTDLRNRCFSWSKLGGPQQAWAAAKPHVLLA